MSLLKRVERGDELIQLSFWCPGCEISHAFSVNPDRGEPFWNFNGDMEKPTFSPSLHVSFYSWDKNKDVVCHLFVKNGNIQFLNDCHHQYAGQTIPLKDIDYETDAGQHL